jgi:hypothetical protein
MTQYSTATYRDGQLILDNPVDFVDGQKVYVAIAPDAVEVQAAELRPEEAGWDDPVQVQARIERLRAIEPWQMTAEEEREWMGFREQVKQYTIDAMQKQVDFNP